MNKIKMMLMAVATFAVVGGALAFKAKKFGVSFCYSTTWTKAVPKSLVGAKTIVAPSFESYYTTTTNLVNCHLTPTLISTSTFLTSVEPG